MDPMGFGIFKHLSLVADAAGNDIPAVYLAALAIRQDATFVTADRAFARIKGLELRIIE